jgi:hypothetical protein
MGVAGVVAVSVRIASDLLPGRGLRIATAADFALILPVCLPPTLPDLCFLGRCGASVLAGCAGFG